MLKAVNNYLNVSLARPQVGACSTKSMTYFRTQPGPPPLATGLLGGLADLPDLGLDIAIEIDKIIDRNEQM